MLALGWRLLLDRRGKHTGCLETRLVALARENGSQAMRAAGGDTSASLGGCSGRGSRQPSAGRGDVSVVRNPRLPGAQPLPRRLNPSLDLLLLDEPERASFATDTHATDGIFSNGLLQSVA